MDNWAEADLAWELIEAISARLTDRERAQLSATVGSGQSYIAIATALQTIARLRVPVSAELITKVMKWLGPYAHSEDASRLCGLIRAMISASR